MRPHTQTFQASKTLITEWSIIHITNNYLNFWIKILIYVFTKNKVSLCSSKCPRTLNLLVLASRVLG